MKKRSEKKRRLVLSMGYWFGAHSLGLLLHPYQSMRRIVREKVFVPLVLLPGVCLFFWWVLGVLVAHLNVLSGLGLSFLAAPLEKFGSSQIVLSFGWLWVSVGLVLWQGLLLYLWKRFRVVMGV